MFIFIVIISARLNLKEVFMTKLAITGPLGHIGSAFIHQIKPGEFEEVRLIDNLLTQRVPSLFHLPMGTDFRWIEADICQANLDVLFEDIDVVVHLAAMTNAEASLVHPDEVRRINRDGTLRVAYSAIKNGCRLVFPSTTSVYGSQEQSVDEKCSIKNLNPQSPYAETKLDAEKYIRELGRTHGLNYVIARLGTIVGASIGMRFHTAVNKFVWQAIWGEPISLWKTAYRQYRPYLTLYDAVRALRFFIENEKCDGNIFNVLTDNLRVSDIIQVLRKYFPDLEMEMTHSKIMNQLSYHVENKKIQRYGFSFHGNFEEEIIQTIEFISGQKAVKVLRKEA